RIVNANLLKREGRLSVIAAPARADQVVHVRAAAELPWQDVVCVGAKDQHDPVAFQVRAGWLEGIPSHYLAERRQHFLRDQANAAVAASVAIACKHFFRKSVW